jgi:hypothetical protein
MVVQWSRGWQCKRMSTPSNLQITLIYRNKNPRHRTHNTYTDMGNLNPMKKNISSRLLTEAVTDLVLPLTQSIYFILGRSVVLHRHLVEPVQNQSQTETQTIEGMSVRILR